MKNIKKFSGALMLGLLMTLSATAFAQTPPRDDSTKESCCSMPDCCCSGDSCPVKKSSKNHAKKRTAKDGCCCGDSCDMKMKQKQDNKTPAS
jgi:hypothetical protein